MRVKRKVPDDDVILALNVGLKDNPEVLSFEPGPEGSKTSVMCDPSAYVRVYGRNRWCVTIKRRHIHEVLSTCDNALFAAMFTGQPDDDQCIQFTDLLIETARTG